MIIKLMQISLLKKLYIFFTNICSVIPDEIYLKMIFRIRTGKKLNLKNPKTFNEKIQWLKLHNRDKSYSVMVDKYRVREYVADKIGEEYLIPLLGVYDDANDIVIDELPEEFVIKCTHDSGSVVLCKRKQDLTLGVRKKINQALKRKYYYASREYPYKNVRPRIIVEKMMHNSDGKGLIDYKFYCFHGEPKFLYVSAGLDNHMTARISFYNMDLSDAPFQRRDYQHFKRIPQIPVNYKKMVEIAKILSKGIPFVRIDLYEIDGSVYFSEITFSPCAGMMPFEPKEYDALLGRYIDLEKV